MICSCELDINKAGVSRYIDNGNQSTSQRVRFPVAEDARYSMLMECKKSKKCVGVRLDIDQPGNSLEKRSTEDMPWLFSIPCAGQGGPRGCTTLDAVLLCVSPINPNESATHISRNLDAHLEHSILSNFMQSAMHGSSSATDAFSPSKYVYEIIYTVCNNNLFDKTDCLQMVHSLQKRHYHRPLQMEYHQQNLLLSLRFRHRRCGRYSGISTLRFLFTL